MCAGHAQDRVTLLGNGHWEWYWEMDIENGAMDMKWGELGP